jgi:hypothetical protein
VTHDLEPLAEQYVKLVLAVGQHEPDYVDAYYGPEQLRAQVRAEKWTIAEIADAAARLVEQIGATSVSDDAPRAMRRSFLLAQTGSLLARVRMPSGERSSFDEECQAVYGVRARGCDEAELAPTHAELDTLLPGTGALGERLRQYRKSFIIPDDKVDLVMRTALEEARRRTLASIHLPAHEQATLELVTEKPWGGYNWFKGNAESLIQINTDLPNVIWRAVVLAAHEGYPGHHVHSTLLEHHLVRGRGWIEFAIHPLESPMSVVAEGSADYGVELAFPDMAEYMGAVLFPLAGLDSAEAPAFVRVQELAAKLSCAEIEAARRYLDGVFDRGEATAWLREMALESEEIAARTIDFFESARSYVVTYDVGRELVKGRVESNAGLDAAPAAKWRAFSTILASPPIAAELATEAA